MCEPNFIKDRKYCFKKKRPFAVNPKSDLRMALDRSASECSASECSASECSASECAASECSASECSASECSASEYLALEYLVAEYVAVGWKSHLQSQLYLPQPMGSSEYWMVEIGWPVMKLSAMAGLFLCAEDKSKKSAYVKQRKLT